MRQRSLHGSCYSQHEPLSTGRRHRGRNRRALLSGRHAKARVRTPSSAARSPKRTSQNHLNVPCGGLGALPVLLLPQTCSPASTAGLYAANAGPDHAPEVTVLHPPPPRPATVQGAPAGLQLPQDVAPPRSPWDSGHSALPLNGEAGHPRLCHLDAVQAAPASSRTPAAPPTPEGTRPSRAAPASLGVDAASADDRRWFAEWPAGVRDTGKDNVAREKVCRMSAVGGEKRWGARS